MSEATRPYKTKNCLSLVQRIKVINCSEENETLRTAQLAEMFDCSYSQIREILLKKDSIRKAYENENEKESTIINVIYPPHQPQLQHIPEMKAIKFITLEWFLRCKYLEIVVDDNTILDIAQYTASILQYNEFRQKVNKHKKKWIRNIRSAENSREFKTYLMKLNNKSKTSLRIEDIIVEIYNVLPISLQQKLKHLLKNNNNIPLDIKMNDENVAFLNWNDEIISLGSSDSEMENIDVGCNEYNNYNEICVNDNIDEYKNEISINNEINNSENDFKIFDDNIITDNNEFITFTDFDENPDNKICRSGSIQNYHDALEQIKRLEEFALNQEDINAIYLINDLKLHFKNRIFN